MLEGFEATAGFGAMGGRPASSEATVQLTIEFFIDYLDTVDMHSLHMHYTSKSSGVPIIISMFCYTFLSPLHSFAGSGLSFASNSRSSLSFLFMQF